ncbi:MAG: IclR family transcriptional regulator [Actinomycetes bacterium]
MISSGRSTERSGPSQPVQSVDRALDLLAAVAASESSPTVAELAEGCGINRSTAWRLLATLESHGMVERAPASSGYRVGYGAVRLGAAADEASVVRRVRPALEDLASATGETVSLALVKIASLRYIDHISVIGAPFSPWTEERVSLHSTSSGKIFLAWLSDAERDGALPATLERFTQSTTVDRVALDAELVEARRRGYACCTGEDAALTNGVSSAVLDARRRPIAVVNVWGPERRIPVERFDELGPLAVEASHQVAGLLA